MFHSRPFRGAGWRLIYEWYMHLAQLQKNHTQCSPSGLPILEKPRVYFMVGDPWALKPQKSTSKSIDSAPHTASAHSPSRTLPSVKWGQTHLLGHFSRTSPGSKAPCSHPSGPLTLLSKVSLSQACSFSTSLIRFLLWSCEKQGAPDWSSGGWNHLQAPSP